MEAKMIEVNVFTKSGIQKILFRDLTTFSKLEHDLLHVVFGRNWLNNHPIMFTGKELTLDLSTYSFVAEELQSLVSLYNNPQIFQKIAGSKHEDLKKLQNIAGIFNLESKDLMLSPMIGKQKLLILFNLRILFCKEKEDVIRSHVYDMKYKHNAIYKRPNSDLFLKKVLEHPRSIVGICSSMMTKNIQPIYSLFFRNPEVKRYQWKILPKFFSREYTIPSPSEEDEHETIRDFNKILTELKGEFESTNTLLIECNAEKGKYCKENLLTLLPYDKDAVENYIPNNSYYMSYVTTYVTALLDNAENIPEYLIKTPFTPDENQMKNEDVEFKKLLENQGKVIKKEDEQLMNDINLP